MCWPFRGSLHASSSSVTQGSIAPGLLGYWGFRLDSWGESVIRAWHPLGPPTLPDGPIRNNSSAWICENTLACISSSGIVCHGNGGWRERWEHTSPKMFPFFTSQRNEYSFKPSLVHINKQKVLHFFHTVKEACFYSLFEVIALLFELGQAFKERNHPKGELGH